MTDFITYWLPTLLTNKLSLCTFQDKTFFEHIKLNVTPKPDTLIRIFLSIKKLDSPIEIKEQKLEHIERKGFTVVEWGGLAFKIIGYLNKIRIRYVNYKNYMNI